ncbi:hypothetical protein GCM10027275_25390 [Rhabdobacter roseus]|uniref:Tetratricopeptide repeat protein n=1 Tax=Rhabdobacter roseus TaxID=1655419 RepID=A0A840TT86_9BACT|nr:hypothetical protein [Rhabdobacter roseus]MBB5284483.1 hypothetical protein [Rhabdobacter roseus]
MRIKRLLYLFFALTLAQSAQAQLFQNRNLYDVWITAEYKLNAGRFEEALKLYETAPEVPEFRKRLATARELHALFQQAERLYRSQKYAEALEIYSQYRAVDKALEVAVFERRIQACLQQIDKVLSKKLSESTRVVAGFEWAYKGERQLSVLDTAGALRSFTKARQLGASLNSTLREQYQEGLREVQAMRDWGAAYRQALETRDPERIAALLRTYRLVSKYIIGTLEYEIKSQEEILSGGNAQDPATRLQRYAAECSSENLLNYIRNNQAQLTRAHDMLEVLREYRQIEANIAGLKKDPENGAFLESAYNSLIHKGTQVPQVGTFLQLCAQKEYYHYLMQAARQLEKEGDESTQKDKYEAATRYLVNARQLNLPEYWLEIDEMQRRISDKLGCESSLQDFERAVVDVRQNLVNCRIQEGKRGWDEAWAKLSACAPNETGLWLRHRSLRDSLYYLARADSLFSVLSSQANRELQLKQCSEARQLYLRMSSLAVCDAPAREVLVADGLRAVAECEKSICYAVAKDQATAAAAAKEWQQAYDYYQQAHDCASPAQQEIIRQIMADLECDAYPSRCYKNVFFVRLEPTLRVSLNKPAYTENDVKETTGAGYHTAAGLQLSFITHKNPVDFVVGADFFRTQYQSLGTVQGTSYATNEFDISGLNVHAAIKLHRPNTAPERLRPYLKLGVESIFPLSYHRQDFISARSTNDRSLLKKQSLAALGAAGVEIQRKKFGFFAEVAGTYNFSGIYNTNAINGASTQSRSEAYFRTLGVRVGVRLW